MANIPLPALNVSTNYPSPLDEYLRAAQLKSSLQQQQVQSQQIQMQQMELNDQKNLRSLAPQFVTKDEDGKVSGFDTEGYFNAALGAGVNPNKITAMRAQQVEMQKNLTQLGSEKLSLLEKQHDQAFQIMEGVRSEAAKGPEQGQTAYTASLPKLHQLGMDVSQFPTQYPGSDGVDHFEAVLGLKKQQLEQAKTVAATKESQQKTEESAQKTALDKIDAELKGNEAKWYQEHGIPPNVPLDKAEAAQWMMKNQGKDLADYMRYKSTLPINTRYSLETGAGIPPAPPNATPDQQKAHAAQTALHFGLTPEAFDQAADKYFQTGQLPSVGRGVSGIALQRAISNRTAELHPGESLAEGSAEYKANMESLKGFQKQFDSVTAFENTAEKNIDRLLTTAKNIPDLGAKFANVPVRMLTGDMIGTENMARFKADLLTAQNEAAKVLNSANMTGVLSDTARKELQEIASGNMPYPALAGAFDELKGDMGRRKQAYQDQINDIKQRTKLGATSASKTPTASSTEKPKVTPGGKAPRTADGAIDWNAYDK